MDTSFKDLGVAAPFLQRLDEIGITRPTEIQLAAIPLLLNSDRDLVAQAQTGTGKTAAFGLPLLQKTRTKAKGIQALVLSPTRELARQIGKELFRFTKYCQPKIFTEVACGGEPIGTQIAALQRPTHILVATPGRLIDLLKRDAVDISHIRTLVLDEADEMLKMGFKDQLQSIFGHTSPGQHHTWLFSATLDEGIQNLIRRHMNPDAKRIAIDAQGIVNRAIAHRYLVCEQGERYQAILDYLDGLGDERGVIFSRTRASAIALAHHLEEDDLPTALLHGDLAQKDRDKVMRAFRKGRVQWLVSTDVSARGIDVEGLAYVLHDQLPDHIEAYTHRSGRTGRAGKKGTSIAFIHPKERKKLHAWEKQLGIVFSEL